jgi:small GTP-binding protein
MSDSSSAYKIVVVGASGVGKTCLLLRLVDGSFDAETESTIGIEYRPYSVTVDGETIKLHIWDTAGQERFRSISRSYFRGAIGAIVVFALNDSDSFEDLHNWINDLHTYASPNTAVLLVGNKADMVDARQVTAAEAESFAQRHAISYLETSALDGRNVAESFCRLTREIRDRVRRGEIKGEFETPKAPEVATETTSCPC